MRAEESNQIAGEGVRKGNKMKKRRKRRKGSSFRGMCSIFAVILALLVVLSVKNSELKASNAVYREELAAVEAKIMQEEERAKEIAAMAEYMQSDAYVEQIAKDKLGLVYEDEIVFKPQEN